MKDKMNEVAFASSGLLMAISLTIFIFYVVWQNIKMDQLILKRLGSMLEAGTEPLKYLQLKEKHDEEVKEWHRRTFRSWYAILVLTIGPAAMSTAILLSAFVIFILKPLPWDVLWRAIVSWFE